MWHHCHQFFTSCSVTVTTFAVFPSWMYLLGGDDNCMLFVPFSMCDLHISCWQGGDSCCSFYVVQQRTVVFLRMRMTSFLSGLAVLLTCYLLHDSRLLGPTLRPSAPVCCCHRVSWTRRRLALAQETARCPPFILFLLVLLVVALVRWSLAACG